tara:strand:+ start:160 stop:327 length:168 start_codon:yes stop_codon:yes gene_type:complete
MNQSQKADIELSIDESLCDLEFEYKKNKIEYEKNKNSMVKLLFIIKVLKDSKNEL